MMGASPFLYRIPPNETADTVIAGSEGCAGSGAAGGVVEVGSAAGGVVEVGSAAGGSVAGGTVEVGSVAGGSGDSSVSEAFSVLSIVVSVSSAEVLSGGVSVSVSAMLLVSRADSQADCDSDAAEKNMVRLVSDSGSFVCDGIALDVSVSVMGLRSAEHPHNIPAAKMSISSLLIFMCLIILQI